MGQVSGTKVVTDGLVFSYDSKNVRSYAGPPIQNMATTMVASGSFSGESIAYTAGTEKVKVPSLGPMTVPYMEGYNSNSASYCCLQQFYFVTGNGYVPASGSTTYTYGIVYRTTSGYNHANYMYRYEYNSNGGYVTEAGVHDPSKRIHLGDDWYWAWNTFTTQATTSRLYLRSFYYQYNVLDRHSVAKVLVTPGDYTTLHPSRWPEVNTTRSNAQVVYDLTKATTPTVTGFVYGDDKLTISNTNSAYIDVSPSSNFNMGTQDFTLSAWIKQLDNGVHSLLEARDSSTLQGYLFLLNYTSTGKVSVFINGSSGQSVYYTSASSMPSGSVQNVTAVIKRSNATIEVYLDGKLYDTITGIQSASISGLGNMYRLGYDRGGSTTNIEYYAFNHYNRALSAEEVAQNFNALKGRYGV